jgi:hypothetical protein
MSTTQNPSCSCHVPATSTVDQLFLRAISLQASKAEEIPVIGPGHYPGGVSHQGECISYPREVYLVSVPTDWKPNSWRTAPPDTTYFKTAKQAAEAAGTLNRELIESSTGGTVQSWYIRIKTGSRYGVVSIPVSAGFQPSDEYDMPPAFIRLDGDRQYTKKIIGGLNARLDHCTTGGIRQRAYIARSIRPEDVEPDRINQQTSDQVPDQMEWPIYMIAVPTDWEPKSGSALPPNAKRFNKGRIAVEVATMLNREILKQSTDGFVQSWYIRISKRSERQGVVSVSIPAYLGWKPADEHDRPPAQLTIKGMLADIRHEVAAMNQALSDDQYKAHRFFIGFSISAVPEWDQKPAQPEAVEADPVSKQDAKPQKQKTPFKDKRVSKRETGPVYLIDVPSDYQPFSWKSFPGIFQRLKCLPIAKLAAIEGNQRILDRSQNGTVKAWYIVVEISGGFGIVQITPPQGWKPADAYDMPEAFSVIQDRIERTAYIKTLNQQLDRITNKKTRKRAYSALRVFRPETTEDQPEPKPEPQAVPQTVPADQNGHSVTVSGVRAVPAEKPIKRYQFTGELVSVSDPASTIKEDPKPETADALLKRHGLEIHQVNVDQQKKRLERYLSEMK